MDRTREAFSCIASGTTSQANEELFGWSFNKQCVANSACSLAWMSAGGEMTTTVIDELLVAGDSVYRGLRDGSEQGYERYLYPEELPQDISVLGRVVRIQEVTDVHFGLYPADRVELQQAISQLATVLETHLVEDRRDMGFLFTGLLTTVAFWRFRGLYLFDPHAVNQSRRRGRDERENVARAFKCDGYYSLAGLLLANAPLDGISSLDRQFTVTRLAFEFTGDLASVPDRSLLSTTDQFDEKLHHLVPVVLVSQLDGETFAALNKPAVGSTQAVPKLCLERPIGVISKIEDSSTSCKVRKGPGRPKKIKRGRPKVLTTTREEQVKEAQKTYRENNPEPFRDASRLYDKKHPEVHRDAVKRYDADHPDVHRDAVTRYDTDHPEVNREAVKRYTADHPEVHRDAVKRYDDTHSEVRSEATRRFRVNHPEITKMRHLPRELARKVVEHGPMGYWTGDKLNDIKLYSLKRTSLNDKDIFKCRHCGARLFDEEAKREKWCCGAGANNVLQLPPLSAPFYRNRIFIERARAYNDLFAFCALEVPGGYRHPKGLSFFKIEGRMYHNVYSLDAPGQRWKTGNVEQFVNRCRLYIDDGEERRNIAEGRSLNSQLVDEITDYMLSTNPYVAEFRLLSNEPSESAHLEFEVTTRATHGPVLGDRNTGVEVHAVLSREETASDPSKLCIWKIGDGKPKTISIFSTLLEPFQYPLLFPEGTPGWFMKRKNNRDGNLTQQDYARCLLLSEPRFSNLGRLSQAWQVEMFARCEEERLWFIKRSQELSRGHGQLRAGPLDELVGAVSRRVSDDIANDETVQGDEIHPGKIFLPSTFTGGPRYMKVHYENAMGLVARLGSPTFFLTFTYSAQWKEHKEACAQNFGRCDPSTACRIFKIKLLQLLRDLRSGCIFGVPAYTVYVIEMQMRGLPHAHIVFKVEGDGPVQAHEIDLAIRADIPGEHEAGGRLRQLVLQHMIHGPCGTEHRTDFRCWDSEKGICTKYYPKPQVQTTHADDRGFVKYRRDWSNKGYIETRSRKIQVDDGWVVPYNPALLLTYEAHINLELASTRRVIKYLFKYLMKGGSLQNVTVTPLREQSDEVKHYITKRMVGASDACWRLLDFNISESEPTVECLPVHLKDKQIVYFKEGEVAEAVARASSKLIIYFDRPRIPIFEDVTYQTFYETFVFHTSRPRGEEVYEHQDGKHFITPRKRGEKVCRLFWVSPNRGEQYYLRLLLMTIPCRGYADLLSKGGADCETFQELARRLGLIDDEQEYKGALDEASKFMVGPRLRSFFVLLCNMGAPAAILWEAFREVLCEDHIERNPLDLERAYKLALLEIDRSLRRQGSCLSDHGLPFVRDDTTELGRVLLEYGENQQREYVDSWEPRLSPDQKRVFDRIRALVDGTADPKSSRVLFLDGPGGYGKTQLIRVLLAYVRSRGQVALAVASSGIAAGNMSGGTTSHSMFRLPLDLGNGSGVWNLTNGSQRAELIRAARLIVFDEAPMAHRYIFEMIDRSLRDLMNCDEFFGGKIFLCSGDFRQIAPVVEKARTPEDVICVSLRASHLWRHMSVFALTTAQRTSGDPAYSEYLLEIGNGTLSTSAFEEEGKVVDLVPLRHVRHVTSLEEFIEDVFPAAMLRDPDSCARRAILTTLNKNVRAINDRVLDCCDGNLHRLMSADSVDREDDDGLDVDVQVLNLAQSKGVPDHILRIKVGSVCLVMRNLNIADGLVNGTKVIVTAISRRLITVRMPGDHNLFYGIPRIFFRFPLVEGSPLRVIRRQFPLMLAYAMSGHKSQGQTIEYAGVDLRTECFTHGQLYVLMSRVRSPNDILALVREDRVRDGVAYTKNIVFRDLLT